MEEVNLQISPSLIHTLFYLPLTLSNFEKEWRKTHRDGVGGCNSGSETGNLLEADADWLKVVVGGEVTPQHCLLEVSGVVARDFWTMSARVEQLS